MQKLMIAAMCVLIGTLAYFAAKSPPNTRTQEASWFRVRIPPPTPPEKKYLSEVAAKVNKLPLFICGKEVVLTKQDQATMSHAMMRKVYGTHE